jgi:dTDP-4-amino-4,6-dideoxygalactose transaminase
VKITRDQFQKKLFDSKIGTGIHFIALHLHDYYRKTFGYKPEDYPNAKFISDRTISLPLSASLTDQDVQDVIDAVREALSDAGA